MKAKYYKPIIETETLSRADVLCVSENAYRDFSEIGTDPESGKDLLEMIGSGELWN